MITSCKIIFCLLCLLVGSICFSATLYVDDDAPSDPGPGDSAVSDPLEDGSSLHPFDAIQEAVNIVDVNDVVSVQTGTYYENLVFPGIDFVLTSSNPQDETVVSNTIVDGNDLGRVITFSGTESPNCILTGLKIYNGFYGTSPSSLGDVGGGVFGNHAIVTISNCIIEENFGYAAGGGIAQCDGLIENCLIKNNHSGGAGAIYDCAGVIKNCMITNNHSYNEGIHSGSSGGTITSSSASLENCIVSNNVFAQRGAIVFYQGSISNCIISGNSCITHDGFLAPQSAGLAECNGKISNCTITGNRSSGGWGLYNCGGIIENCIIVSNISNDWSDVSQVFNCPNIRFSCFIGGVGNGNLNSDPLFAQNGSWDDNGTSWDFSDDIWTEGDYHLKSEGWRWYPVMPLWIWDAQTSHCIDAGNPGMDLGEELMPGEIDPGNVRGNNIRINMGAYGGTDKASIALPGWALLCDLDNSGNVDITDFAMMTQAWQQTEKNQPSDVGRNGTVDLEDIGLLGQDWLKTTTWY